MANEDPAAPWTIKAVPVAVREKAVRYARMEGVTMAEWLSRAVETQAAKQEANQVYPPGRPEETSFPSPTIELGEAAAVLQAMAAAAASGLPVTKAAVRDTVSLIREQIRVGRGLPARQTKRPIGQTISLEHETPERDEAEGMPATQPVTRNGSAGEQQEAGGVTSGQASVSEID
jgi:hypothetical protein